MRQRAVGSPREMERNILECLLRLRIFCNTGLLSNTDAGSLLLDPGEFVSLFRQSGRAEYPKCHVDFIALQGVHV